MKNLLSLVFISMVFIPTQAQESLIAGIMQVEPVNLTIGEEDQEKVDKYDADFAEEQTGLQEELTKQSEDYAADVTKLVEKFTDIMTKGEERMISNEKQNVNSKANAMTFNLIRDKKATIQRFHNEMSSAMRTLPRPVQKMKQKDLDDFVEEQRKLIHDEFEANQRVLKAFKATEHVTKTHISEMPSESTN